jgi:hypothetical protein
VVLSKATEVEVSRTTTQRIGSKRSRLLIAIEIGVFMMHTEMLAR